MRKGSLDEEGKLELRERGKGDGRPRIPLARPFSLFPSRLSLLVQLTFSSSEMVAAPSTNGQPQRPASASRGASSFMDNAKGAAQAAFALASQAASPFPTAPDGLTDIEAKAPTDSAPSSGLLQGLLHSVATGRVEESKSLPAHLPEMALTPYRSQMLLLFCKPSPKLLALWTTATCCSRTSW
jgi:hypothetical protein